MGDYADMMLDGTCCSSCGECLGGDEGYPVQCAVCGDDDRMTPDLDIPNFPKTSRALRRARNQSKPHTNCPTCGKRVKVAGLADHMRVVHRETGRG